MTDITEEQKEAWLRVLGRWIDQAFDNDLSLIAPLLPSELTNPQPALPTEPGAYRDAHGLITILDPRGRWHGTYGDLINPEICAQPFTRLVPERPKITREGIEIAFESASSEIEGLDAIFRLVNGAEQ